MKRPANYLQEKLQFLQWGVGLDDFLMHSKSVILCDNKARTSDIHAKQRKYHWLKIMQIQQWLIVSSSSSYLHYLPAPIHSSVL